MNRINGTDFKEMLLSGAAHLSNRHDAIDALNVFPVPMAARLPIRRSCGR